MGMSYWVKLKTSLNLEDYKVKYFIYKDREIAIAGKYYAGEPLMISGEEYSRGDLLPEDLLQFFLDQEEVKKKIVYYLYQGIYLQKSGEFFIFKDTVKNQDKFKEVFTSENLIDVEKFNIVIGMNLNIRVFTMDRIKEVLEKFKDYNAIYDEKTERIKLNEPGLYSITIYLKNKQKPSLRIVEDRENTSVETVKKLKLIMEKI